MYPYFTNYYNIMHAAIAVAELLPTNGIRRNELSAFTSTMSFVEDGDTWPAFS